MRAIRFITARCSTHQAAAHRCIHITACLVAFAVLLVSSTVAQSAAALGPGVSDTPSTTEPYYACPHGLCDAVIDPPVIKTKAGYELPDGGPLLEGSGEEGGYDPKDLQSAYNIPTSGGEGQTVALVDAYGDTTVESDLAKYREKYGLPACTKANGCFKKVNQTGEEGNYPEASSADWELETSLDVDMVSAACPHCHILLVEATAEGMSNLGASVNEAVELGATEVSNSYGAPEDYEPWCGSTGCSQYDSDYDHPGVFISASAGDYGYDNEFFGGVSLPSFPGTSQYVTAVGGTSLHKASNSRGWSEKVWYESGRSLGTGSGCSGFEPKPTWQTNAGCTKRTDDDVAAVGACETPVSIYVTAFGGWENVCGTSASSPLVAAIVAHTSSSTRSLGAKAFYEDSGALYDVTEGSNGSCGNELCVAEVGYDGPTGWGTPDGLPEPPSRPSVITESASAITSDEATLHGTVNPESLETYYHYEYGTTTSYGTSTPEANIGSGASKLEVSQTASGLSSETIYHYRLVATNSDGSTYGSDHTFTTSGWAISSTPNQSGLAKNLLNDVSCSSSTSCVSVGWYVNNSGIYTVAADTWNGAEWAIHNPPAPSGATLSSLVSVSCSSSTACTGVGHYINSSGTTVTLAERWNGTEWSIQSTPNPSGATSSDLWGVSCASSTSCVATGEYINSSGTTVTLAERWNGTEWSIQSTPNPSGATASSLQSVSCTSSSACTAVGDYDGSGGVWYQLAERWNGTEWSVQSTPTPSGSGETFFRGVSCTSSTACTAVGYYYATGVGVYATFPERWNGTEWTIQSMKNPSGAKGSYLQKVSCATSTSCTATGEYVNSSGTTVTLAQKWNGTEWSLQLPANPSGAQESTLKGVSCTSATACTSVGHYLNNQGITTSQVQRWNGTEWSIQTTSNQSGLAKNLLNDVSCSSSTSCVSVGWYVNNSGIYTVAADTWNGAEWAIHNPPAPSGATLSSLVSVSCSSSTACTGVGHYINSSGTTVTLAERWNGTEWSIQSTPNPSGATSSDLWGVSCASSTSCVATGEYINSSGTTVTLAERWNGTEWSIQSTPNPSGATASSLQSVSCTSSSACTAVGDYDGSGGVWYQLAERWNGTEWSVQSTPTPSGSGETFFRGVSCTSSTACTAVGYYYATGVGVYATFPERWNGTEWTIQSMKNPSGAKGSYLQKVSCATSTSCTATGEYVNSSGITVTLAQRWNGTEWSLQLPSNPTGAEGSALRGVSCTSSTVCTSVGWYMNNQGTTTNLVEGI